MKSKILRTYTKLSESQLYVTARHIVGSIKDQATRFANPDPTIAYSEQLLLEYGLSLQAAKSRDKDAVELKNSKYDQVIELLDNHALHVAKEAKGNREILISSGFDISRETINRSSEDLSVTTGTAPGHALVVAKAVKGAKTYIHQFTTDPLIDSSVWTQEVTTRRSHTHTGLVPGQKYWFRVIAIGTRGQKTWSDPVARIVQ